MVTRFCFRLCCASLIELDQLYSETDDDVDVDDDNDDNDDNALLSIVKSLLFVVQYYC